jgi:hypothetical protein
MLIKLKMALISFIAFFFLNISFLNAFDFNRGCYMYLHDNYQGGVSYLIHSNAEVYVIGTAWNDQISSFQVPSGCRLQLFKDWKFQGQSTIFPSGSYPSLGSDWNDHISSAKCICQ